MSLERFDECYELVNYAEERLAHQLEEDRRFRAACAAMQGIVASGAVKAGGILASAGPELVKFVADRIAREAVALSDALLERLAVKP